MIDYRLTSEQLVELRAADREASDIRSAYRIHVLILLGQGWSVAQVADALLIDRETVRRYVKRYRKGGLEGLLRVSYVGGEALLNEQQLAELDAYLQTRAYLSVKAVAEWVKERRGVSYTSTLALIRQIEAKHPECPYIPVSCDNASYYRSKTVQEYLETSRVELIFLPPYSPNLNLIERLWLLMKREILYGAYYPTFKEFKMACESFFRELGSYESKLRSPFAENFQIPGVLKPHYGIS